MTVKDDTLEAHIEEFEDMNKGPQAKQITHWIDSQKNRNRFWARASELQMGRNEVHELFGVQTMYDHKGTFQEAMRKLDLAVEKLKALDGEKLVPEPEQPEIGVDYGFDAAPEIPYGDDGGFPPDDETFKPQPPKALVKSSHALTVYGDRDDVKELSERITKMLPGVRSLGQSGALALAQVAYSMGLNPFIGEIWPIPQKDRSGRVVGFSIMAGIKGLRRAARKQAELLGGVYPFYHPKFRMMTDDEKELADLKDGDKALICELELVLAPGHPWYKANDFQRFVIEGVGIVRGYEKSKMETMQLIRKRAEADALKIAFDLPFGDSGDDFAVDAEYSVNGSE